MGKREWTFFIGAQCTREARRDVQRAAGGSDNGEPGERPCHPGYHAAFVIDPDGYNVAAVFHGPADRSTESVKITFSG